MFGGVPWFLEHLRRSFNSLGNVAKLEEALQNLHILVTHSLVKNRTEAETLAKKGAGRSGGIALQVAYGWPWLVL